MTYIINPFYFYLVEIFGMLDFVAIFCGIVFLLISTFACSFYYSEHECTPPFFKKFIIAGAISLFVGILIPSQTTVEKMLIARYVTIENYEHGKKEVKEIIDYIFDKFENREEDKK